MVPRRSRPRSRPPDRHRAYHLGLERGSLPEWVLVPGDPDRASRIASTWDQPRALQEAREFRSYRGQYRGVPLAVVSAGIGGSSMSIVMDELAQIGVRGVIRVGTCGAVDRSAHSGDLAISLAAARFERISEAYAPLGYPAVSDPSVFRALVEAARERGVPFHTGITATVGTFYPEQGRPGFAGRVTASSDPFHFREFARLRILNVEMECATMFTMASIFGLKAGAVCTVLGETRDGTPRPEDPGPAIAVANEAVVRLWKEPASSPRTRRRSS